ncbi:hypothetical protein FB384_001440 [Prauserella sediminis]|uniref:Uncharacterized protein n=1 Tax=Prauserella sediminis TaxID=577680 RepID=A0A839XRE7_9PSEU|nr:hypothetical protein [Prauserella sediminis]MBB3662536.1 hypothetical protein [Prauserella sediminis]
MSMTIWIWVLVGLGSVAVVLAVLMTRPSRTSRAGSYPAPQTGSGQPPPVGQPLGTGQPAAAGPDPIGVAAAAPAMPLEHRMKPYDALRDCRVWFDDRALRWSLRASSRMIHITMGTGEIPLSQITGIRLVDIQQGAQPQLNPNIQVPPGPAVAVATPQGEACFAAENPQLLAAQLGARLRALGVPGWTG